MSTTIAPYSNILYSRTYENDAPAPEQTDYVKRIALAAVPFFALHQSLRFPVSLCMDTLRFWTTDPKDIFGTVMAVTALASTVFLPQAGTIITNIHDTIIEIKKLREVKDWQEGSKSLVKIANNLIYLALVCRGGLELSIIACAMQTVINLIQSRDEFKKKHWIEGVANLLMAGIRLHQTHLQYHVYTEAQTAFQYFCNEVEKDASLSHDEQHKKIQEFKNFTDNLTPEVASRVTNLLLQKTRTQIFDMLQSAGLDSVEIDTHLADYEKTILQVENTNVEFARQMLFFVAELKIHRQYVHDFGIALGCPEKQLLRHDLCKLDLGQFEGYARYFRGGRRDEDKAAFLAAWKLHQLEEHHLESYSKEGFDFGSFSEERLQNNMLETVADWLAATKQRGGSTLIDYLTHVFSKKEPHPNVLPYLEKALIKAQTLYQNSEENPDSSSIFKGFPCWNSDVETVFRRLRKSTIEA